MFIIIIIIILNIKALFYTRILWGLAFTHNDKNGITLKCMKIEILREVKGIK